MFGRKKKDKKNKKINNEIFGEMELKEAGCYGTAPIQITLWNKAFYIDLRAVTNSASPEITTKQELAYKYFKENTVYIQKKIEEIIEDDCKTKDTNVLLSRFEPFQLFFTVNGRCALLLFDAKDIEEGYHEDLAVSIIPELKLWSEEDYVMHGICEEYKED